jgi:hypothetical protein
MEDLKMRIKIILLCFLIFLNACTNKENVDDVLKEDNIDNEDVAIEDNLDNNDVAIEEILDNKDNEIADEQIKFSLKDIPLSQLEKTWIIEEVEDRLLFENFLSTTEIISDTEAIFSDDSYRTVRNSSQALYCEEYDEGYNNDLINTNISTQEFLHFDSSGNVMFTSPFNITKNDTTLILDGSSDDYSQIKVKDIIYGYSVDNITVNCFIRETPSYSFDVIIDPAYMYGLPVYHTDSSLCDFTINGLNIKSDTLNFTVRDIKENLKSSLKELDSSYVYAQITFDKINCKYGINSGYESTASICDYKLLTKDTERVLTRTFLFDNLDNKDSEMIQTYNTLMSNIDILNTDLTLGITLLDLDFDNSPEVLVTRYNTATLYEIPDNEVADVDIYRIENNNLIYIGTLYNYHTIIYELGNILGLKTLEDGSKAWFNMSYKNRDSGEVSDTDYLFTLEGNELKFKEIFGNGGDGKYRYLGEIMEFSEEPFIDERFGSEMVMVMYSWGNYKTIYGTWEIIGKIKQDYCEDMKENSFNLYSNWLSYTDPYNKSYKLPLTERMLSYNVAYLVDSYYLGSYNANKQYFEYRFLGDYAKPVIYLYPTIPTDISVKIDLNGVLTCTYPEYNDGWNVTANPDGTLVNKADGREYSYLYWEGKGEANWDFSNGFVIKGSDTMSFLQEKLEYLGLTARELNEFIVYWLPIMKDNEYNLITFQTTAYENNAKLDISPKPDNILRVFMAFKALNKYIEIPEQQLSTFDRSGFTVVEWGGTEVK